MGIPDQDLPDCKEGGDTEWEVEIAVVPVVEIVVVPEVGTAVVPEAGIVADKERVVVGMAVETAVVGIPVDHSHLVVADKETW